MAVLQYLRRYACIDAEASGLEFDIEEGLSEEDEIIALGRFMAHCGRYMEEDANGDNQKRNIAIRLFMDADLETIRKYGRAWLGKWQNKYENQPWFTEWSSIIETATDDRLVYILLSADEDATRIRSSMPFPGLLDFDVVLKVKRMGVPKS